MTRTILLLAAGSSSRMRGRDKLLEVVDGQPLLRVLAERALTVCERVHVALPETDSERNAALSGLAVSVVSVANPETGISASIKAGVDAVGGDTALMILPADLPEVTSDDMKTAWNCFEKHEGNQIIRATDANGTPGHPTIFPAAYTSLLKQLTGDQGAVALIKQHGFTRCQLPGNHATTDLDTPEDWDDWRKK